MPIDQRSAYAADGSALTKQHSGAVLDERREFLNDLTTHVQSGSTPLTLFRQALSELADCLASLGIAEEVLRTQNDALAECEAARLTEHRRSLELFTSTTDVLLVTGADGMIFEANPAAASMLNVSLRLLVASPVTRFFGQGERAALMEVLLNAQAGAAWYGSLRLQPRHYEAFDVMVDITPLSVTKEARAILRWLIRPDVENDVAVWHPAGGH